MNIGSVTKITARYDVCREHALMVRLESVRKRGERYLFAKQARAEGCSGRGDVVG